MQARSLNERRGASETIMNETSHTIDVGGRQVPLLLVQPPSARWLYVFAHGAGAGMRHRFMAAATDALAAQGIATLRYEYPYMSGGSRRPDPAPVLEAVTRAVATYAAAEFPALRIAAGGKSMGGRMTSRAHADAPLPRVAALIFFGFPLHPAGKPGRERADHLRAITTPMLFLQGTRDALATWDLITEVTAALPSATLHVVDGADHGFAVLRRSGRTDAEVLAQTCAAAAHWLDRLAKS
jgi:uncharacterized protein